MNRQYYYAGITAFVIWGFFSIPLRALQDYPPGEILFFRILTVMLLLAIGIPLFRRKQARADWEKFKASGRSQKSRTLALTMLGGLLLSLNWLVFIITVNEINVKTASFSYLVCPVITAILGYVLLRERMTLLQWTAVGLCVLSCVLIGLNSVHELQYSLFVALSYASYLISQRRNQGYDRLVSLGIQILFSLILLSVFYGFLVESIPGEIYFYGVILVIAVLFTLIPLFLNLYALNAINSATIGILMYLNPLLNFCVAIVIFKETVNELQVTGYLIIFLALILFNYPYLQRLKTIRHR